MLFVTPHVATSVESLDTGLKTVDPCCGLEATSHLDSPSTSQQEVIQPSIIQSSEDLAQVQEIVQKYELESRQSLTIKRNMRKNLGF